MRVTKLVLSVSTVVALAAGTVPVAEATPDAPAASSGTTAAAAAAPTERAYRPPRIRWGRCAEDYLREGGARCGTLVVPADYSRPRGPKLRLAVSRVLHRGKRDQGVMITNPGGPGAAGLGMALVGGYVPGGAGRSYDWIGMDPRGVGESRPQARCQPGEEYEVQATPRYKPAAASDDEFWSNAVRDLGEDCARNTPTVLLRHLRTVDVARDVDTLRRALGERRINFFGASYGTYLGRVYQSLFPGRVRRMVLDSVVDADRTGPQINAATSRTFQRNLDLFLAWVAEHDGVYDAGSSLAEARTRFLDLAERLYAEPADGVVGGNQLYEVVFPVYYSVELWPQVARLYSALLNDGETAGVVEALQSTDPAGDDNGNAAYLGTTCTDSAWPRDADSYRRAATAAEGTHPIVAWQGNWFDAQPCMTWAASGKRLRADRGRGTPRALILGETLDAPTPYAGALRLRRQWPASRLVASTGASHATALFSSPCNARVIAGYLRDGALPARKRGWGPDKVCRGLRIPPPSTGTDERRRPDPVRDVLEEAQRLELRARIGR